MIEERELKERPQCIVNVDSVRYIGQSSGIEVIQDEVTIKDRNKRIDTKYQVNNMVVIDGRFLCAG